MTPAQQFKKWHSDEWLPWAAALLVAGFLFLLVQWAQVLVEKNLHQQEESRLAEIRTRIEATLNQASNASASFSHFIQSYQGEVDPERMEFMAQRLLDRYGMIRNIAFAPNNIITWNFPLEENRFTHGVDLMELPGQREVIAQVMASGEPLLAGPVELVQGGLAVIHRVPVFVENPEGEGSYWGLVSTPILMEYLLDVAAAEDLVVQGRLAFRGKDGQGAKGEVFLGDSALFNTSKTLKTSVQALDGRWQLAYQPELLGGLASLVFGLVYFLILLVFLFVFWLSRRSIKNRQQAFAYEQEAAQLGERLQVATEAAGLGCWDLDIQTGELSWDKKMFAIYQKEPKSSPISNQEWEAHLLPGEKERIEKAFNSLGSDHEVFSDEFRIRRSDGEVRLIKNTVRILRSPQGKVRRLVGINEDITESREGETRLRSAQQEEKRLNEIMAHHFQEPVRRMLVFADQLAKNPCNQDESSRQAIHYIQEQAAYLRNLVQGIQRFMQVTQVHARKKRVDLEQLLRGLLASPSTQEQLRPHQVSIQNLPWPDVFVNPTQILQVFEALLDNAIKHADPEQYLQLTVFAEVHQGRLQVTLSDNGRGLEPQYYQQALELFMNLNTAVNKKYRSGLGLPLAKRIIALHQGHLFLKKSAQGGLAVVFDLPIYYSPEPLTAVSDMKKR
ncbi:ATP-binding protein [Marinospirillum sp.]|uniref:ATP-binding protein n=1 Tax=Marinospirillum sp. TaxID=2183934 RepID=UPI0028706044|nr:ATP-binding protein [Marinospirillum sp.]MDR9467235.1 ATP-binding protein [Marinospirillum sp.]